MPRFPVNFRRKSTVTDDQNGPIEPSFRVIDRSEIGIGNGGKSFDGGVRMMKKHGGAPKTTSSDASMEDNLFVDMKTNRGSSNTTKTASDNSSRHSNASTAPSSTEFTVQDDWRASTRKPGIDVSTPAPPAPNTRSGSGGGFLKNAGKTFSFSSNKKHSLPTIPAEEPVPAIPDEFGFDPQTPSGRSRAQTASTASTATTATPPKLEERDFMMDLGGDLSNMLSAFNKRASAATIKDESGRPVLGSRNLTGNRASQALPSPLHIDKFTAVDPPQPSWTSQGSNDGLLASAKLYSSPGNENIPPPIPRHTVSPGARRPSNDANEDSGLLNDSLAAARFLSNGGSATISPRNRKNGNSMGHLHETSTKPSRFDPKSDDDNMFDTSFSRPSRASPRPASRNDKNNSQPGNKVMTPAEFEKYRQDKVRESIHDPTAKNDSDNDEEDNYEDEEDDREKKQQLAKQRRKQEAHMTVYRQQMMKVTGEQPGTTAPSRPSMTMSMSTPNLPHGVGLSKGPSGSNTPPSNASDEDDEEVPLAILQAHGFPGKNRPPTRLANISSNPNLRASIVGSIAGDSQSQNAAARSSLPAFARKLPQDPFLGAGLLNQPSREQFALGGGQPASPGRLAPPGGLVGVIANEERQKAMRRGSPANDPAKNLPPQMQMPPMNQGFDPMAGIPPQMMYPVAMQPQPMLTPGDQAQIQMTQQMQQFMQMQMQFMQMMASQGQGQQMPQMQIPQVPQQGTRPQGHMAAHSMGSMPDISRNSFLGDPVTMGMGNGMLEPPRGDAQMRTMSMVQPSSSSWIQRPQSSYTPSIHIQGVGNAPSIAPSERSNIGLPGRYRPVSSVNPVDTSSRTATMSGAMPTLSKHGQTEPTVKAVAKDDDDDEEGWEAMKAKREMKKSIWRSKKNYGSDIGALIS